MSGEKDFFVEKNNGPTSFYFSKGNNEELMFKVQTMPLPKNEESLEIYELLERNCNVCFYKEGISPKFKFRCKEQFIIFATDNCGGAYGLIGDDDSKCAIGYIGNDSRCGRIANNLQEFFELVVFYPFWLELLHNQEENINNELTIEDKYTKNITSYSKNQKKIADILKIQKNEKSIENLIYNLSTKPYFVVYELDNRKLYDNLI